MSAIVQAAYHTSINKLQKATEAGQTKRHASGILPWHSGPSRLWCACALAWLAWVQQLHPHLTPRQRHVSPLAPHRCRCKQLGMPPTAFHPAGTCRDRAASATRLVQGQLIQAGWAWAPAARRRSVLLGKTDALYCIRIEHTGGLRGMTGRRQRSKVSGAPVAGWDVW
jgi:hypothetical protein